MMTLEDFIKAAARSREQLAKIWPAGQLPKRRSLARFIAGDSDPVQELHDLLRGSYLKAIADESRLEYRRVSATIAVLKRLECCRGRLLGLYIDLEDRVLPGAQRRHHLEIAAAAWLTDFCAALALVHQCLTIITDLPAVELTQILGSIEREVAREYTIYQAEPGQPQEH